MEKQQQYQSSRQQQVAAVQHSGTGTQSMPAISGNVEAPQSNQQLSFSTATQPFQLKEAHKFDKYDAAGVKEATKEGTGDGVGIGTVNIYKKTIAAKDTRVDAISAAATAMAPVGNVQKTTGVGFTTDQADYNKDAVASIDPFIYRVATAHKQETADDAETRAFELDYQLSKGVFPGYVIKVKDGARSAVMKAQDPTESTDAGVMAEYSNKHAQTGENAISGYLGDDQQTNKKKSEEGFDAVTKLAGEGARFDCVKNNLSTVTDETYFYTTKKKTTEQGGNNKTNPGMVFKKLWNTWGAEFKANYGISNETLEDKFINKKKFSGGAAGTFNVASNCDGKSKKIDITT